MIEREEISQYQSETNCEKCKGLRLKEEALCKDKYLKH